MEHKVWNKSSSVDGFLQNAGSAPSLPKKQPAQPVHRLDLRGVQPGSSRPAFRSESLYRSLPKAGTPQAMRTVTRPRPQPYQVNTFHQPQQPSIARQRPIMPANWQAKNTVATAPHPQTVRPQAVVPANPAPSAAQTDLPPLPLLREMQGQQQKQTFGQRVRGVFDAVTFHRFSKRTKRPLTKKRMALRAAAAMTALVVVSVGWLGVKFMNDTGKVFGGNLASNISGLFKPVPLKGQETGHVNILLAGNSADDPGHDGASLTDSIMLVSLDVVHNKATMFSIPRDLWVDIPGVGHRKINEAYYWGNQNNFRANGYANGGMGLLGQTIEQNMGIPVNYYALVDYSAFRDAVNAVSGITVNIHSSDPRGLYDPSIDYVTNKPLVKLTNGPHRLNGQQALNLARARGSAYSSYGFPRSDFNRTENQRMMLIALKDKAMSVGVVSNPIKLGNLLDAFGNNIKTDLKLNEMMTVYTIMKKIDSSSIGSLAFNDDKHQLLTGYRTPLGQSALVPSAGLDNFSAITAFIKKALSNDPMSQEEPKARVLNGTDTSGLARTEQSALVAKGFTVGSIGDASKKYSVTTIVDTTNGKKPASKAALAKLYPGASFVATSTESNPDACDFVVILGADHTPTTTINTTQR